MKIGIIQQHNTADIKQNMTRLAESIKNLAKNGAELIVLQELHNSLYFCQVEDVDNFDLAEPIPGPSTDCFSQLAKENNVVIVTSLFERRTAGLYHTRRSRFPSDTDICRLSWRSSMLGPMVSRGSTPDGTCRSRDTHLPHRHRLCRI